MRSLSNEESRALCDETKQRLRRRLQKYLDSRDNRPQNTQKSLDKLGSFSFS